MTETQITQGEWIDPERAKRKLGDYADQWIAQRPRLRPRTVELYKWLLRKLIAPDLGGVELGKLSTAVIRQWRADRLTAGVSESVTAKSYRLLRAILNTAQVFDLASRMPERFRALVLLAAFGSLRWGEVTALRRCDASWVRVSRAMVEVPGRRLVVGPPNSRAGVRTPIIPTAVRRDLLRHLDTWVKPEQDALLFTGERAGHAVRRPNFSQRTR